MYGKTQDKNSPQMGGRHDLETQHFCSFPQNCKHKNSTAKRVELLPKTKPQEIETIA